ncbi:hypothetical protein AB205_0118650 [Aquarana catesbeiana]|uniref:Uncharacterized protein n=1 Tax=Aquarana catesbeiana TaxID=8400 RepID=A0A2G9S7R1_AQUCT|nr:hypothetical protein AB205_0118650 [Aquarana catesbeiana]
MKNSKENCRLTWSKLQREPIPRPASQAALMRCSTSSWNGMR